MPTVLPQWVEGALICLFGSTLTALGLVLQKHSHTLSAKAEVQQGRYYLRKWWVCGFLVFISAQVINMVAMAMTPQVVLSCLGAWTLVCNAAFAHLILGESLTAAQRLAVLGLVLAMATVVYNAPRPPPKAAVRRSGNDGDVAERLAGRFLSFEVEVLIAGTLMVVCLARSLAGIGAPRASTPQDAFDEAEAYARSIAALPEGELPPVEEAPRRVLAPLSWATLAAISAGYTALLFKCIAEIIAGGGLVAVYSWETYAIAAVALSCAPTELHCLNLALQTGEAIFVIPMYLTLGMMAQLTTGAVFFQEFKNFNSRSHAIGFAAGVALTVTFVVAMAKAQDDKQDAGELTSSLLEAEEESPELDAPRPSRSFPIAPEGSQAVSVAGFGGAIEVLEQAKTRERRRSEWPQAYRCRQTMRATSVGGRSLLTRADRATSSPV